MHYLRIFSPRRQPIFVCCKFLSSYLILNRITLTIKLTLVKSVEEPEILSTITWCHIKKFHSLFRKRSIRAQDYDIAQHAILLSHFSSLHYTISRHLHAHTHISACKQNLYRSCGGARNWRAILSLSEIARSVFLTIPLWPLPPC